MIIVIKKIKKTPILIVKLKNGNNNFNIEINSDNNIENEIIKKLKEKPYLNEKIIILTEQKIKDAVNTMNKIFEKSMNVYSYKQLRNIDLIFNQSNKINNTILRRNNSVKGLEFKYQMINNDIKPTLFDIKKMIF